MEFTEINESDRKFTDSFAFVAHEDWWRFRNFMHQETFFRMFGFPPENIHTLDQDAYEGAEIIHDMNLPIPKQLKESYDLVIDTGTIEHVFDLKQAFWNLHDLVKTGGSVLHVSPSNLLDHGFINLNAVLLEDFYLQSGWTKEELFYNASPKQYIGDNVFSCRSILAFMTALRTGITLVCAADFARRPILCPLFPNKASISAFTTRGPVNPESNLNTRLPRGNLATECGHWRKFGSAG